LISKLLKTELYKTLNVLAFACGCGTEAMTLKNKYALQVVSENQVCRKMLTCGRDEVSGEWMI